MARVTEGPTGGEHGPMEGDGVAFWGSVFFFWVFFFSGFFIFFPGGENITPRDGKSDFSRPMQKSIFIDGPKKACENYFYRIKKIFLSKMGVNPKFWGK